MATSEKKIQANRRNAKKSTGPITDEGKAIAARNAITHGLTCTKIVPEAEALAYKLELDDWNQRHDPADPTIRILNEVGARSAVRLRRCWAMEDQLMMGRLAAAGDAWDVAQITHRDYLIGQLWEDSAKVAAELETFHEGVKAKIESWNTLLFFLQKEGCWDVTKLRQAINLCGVKAMFPRRTLRAVDMMCHHLHSGGPEHPGQKVNGDPYIDPARPPAVREALLKVWRAHQKPLTPEQIETRAQGKAALEEIVRGEIARLEGKLPELAARAESAREQALAGSLIDLSPQMQLLLRCEREAHSKLLTSIKGVADAPPPPPKPSKSSSGKKKKTTEAPPLAQHKLSEAAPEQAEATPENPPSPPEKRSQHSDQTYTVKVSNPARKRGGKPSRRT